MRRTPSELYGMEPSRPDDYEAGHLDAIRARWDKKAERWDADLADAECHLNEDRAYERFLEAADEIIARRAEFCRTQLLVDLGCGTGLLLAQFGARFAAGLGIDISPAMLHMASQRQLPRTRLIAGDCFELTRHVAAAGAILSRGILLSHYGPLRAPHLLEQVRQSLAPGGFALLDFLNARARSLYPDNPDNKAYYAAEQLADVSRAVGFAGAQIVGEPQRRVLLLALQG